MIVELNKLGLSPSIIKILKRGSFCHRNGSGDWLLRLDSLSGFTEDEITSFPGYGPKTLKVLKQLLRSRNMEFKN